MHTHIPMRIYTYPPQPTYRSRSLVGGGECAEVHDALGEEVGGEHRHDEHGRVHTVARILRATYYIYI